MYPMFLNFFSPVTSNQYYTYRGGEMSVTKSAGEGALDVSLIRAKEGEGCPRCGGKVFMAEEINSRGRVRDFILHLLQFK